MMATAVKKKKRPKNRNWPVAKAAKRLRNVKTGRIGMTTTRVRQLLEEGQIEGTKDPTFGYWVISEREIQRFNRADRRDGRPPEESA